MSLDGISKEPPRYAPGIGQHTNEILSQAGYTADEIEKLIASGVALQQKITG
jgi:crotonobetainyl-CoA:carnitine CoA-transferase CaiB-like acyl-CoA transferase